MITEEILSELSLPDPNTYEWNEFVVEYVKIDVKKLMKDEPQEKIRITFIKRNGYWYQPDLDLIIK